MCSATASGASSCRKCPARGTNATVLSGGSAAAACRAISGRTQPSRALARPLRRPGRPQGHRRLAGLFGGVVRPPGRPADRPIGRVCRRGVGWQRAGDAALDPARRPRLQSPDGNQRGRLPGRRHLRRLRRRHRPFHRLRRARPRRRRRSFGRPWGQFGGVQTRLRQPVRHDVAVRRDPRRPVLRPAGYGLPRAVSSRPIGTRQACGRPRRTCRFG